MFLIVLLIAIGVAVPPLVNSIQLTPEVAIDSGKLQGFVAVVHNTGGLKVRKYLGIPFAQAKRFENPEPPKSWEGVRHMTTLGKVCPQKLSTLGLTEEDISEDCLNLNVYVPDGTKSSERLPVMVWIHGGAFVINRLSDGSYLAALGKVVVVAINYRLNVFGFLTNGRGGDIKGNYGMFDQVEGLKWVKKNIAANPNSPDSVEVTWPEYNLEQQKYMSLKPKMTVNSHLRASYMSYWNWFIPNALRAAPKPKPCPTCKPCSKAGGRKAAGAVYWFFCCLKRSPCCKYMS